MTPKFALFTKESKLLLNKGFKNMFVTTVLRSALKLSLIQCYFSIHVRHKLQERSFLWRNKKNIDVFTAKKKGKQKIEL